MIRSIRRVAPACKVEVLTPDFLRKEGEDWTIEIKTTDGNDVRLERGGAARKKFAASIEFFASLAICPAAASFRTGARARV